jgi:ferredoxin
MPQEQLPTMTEGVPAPPTESLVIRLAHRTHTLDYQAGDTILEAARRAGLRPPSQCEAGNCATCMAHLDAGAVHMRVNDALTPEEVDDGWILTCQSLPTSPTVVVDYDA